MFKVGLTSNNGCGLEGIVEYFQDLGIPVFDADVITKFLLFNDSGTITKIKTHYGKKVFNEHKLNLDNFDDTYKLKKLFSFIEMDLLKIYEKWRLIHVNHVYTIFKHSALFETELSENMNFNINVFRPDALRVNEISKKYDMKYIDAYGLASNEMDQFEKNNLSNFVIHNYDNYSIETLNQQILNINSKISGKLTSKV